MEQKRLVAAKSHTNLMRTPFFGSSQEANQSFLSFFTTKSQKVFTLNLGDIWAGTAMSTTAPARGLISLCAFGSAALRVAHPWFKKSSLQPLSLLSYV